MKNEKKTLQIKTVQNTMDKIAELSEIFHTNSKSDVIKSSVDIASIIAKAISEGGVVTVEDKNGNKNKLIFPGINWF